MATARAKRQERRYSDPRERAKKQAESSGYNRTAYRVPEGMKVFSIKKAGVYRLDIMPFAAGKGNPFADEGMLHYERTFFQHRDIGLDQDAYICLRTHQQVKDFKRFELCPICKYRQEISQSDQALAKKLAPKERQLFNVIDLANPDDGVQLWEISHHLFGKLLDTKINNADEDDEYFKFFYHDDGLTLKCTAAEKSMGGDSKPFYEIADIEFKKRSEQYSDDILEQCACLDDLLIQLDYDKLEAIFTETAAPDDEDSGEGEEEDEDDEPSPKPSRKPSATSSKTTKPAPKSSSRSSAAKEEESEDDEPSTPNGITVGDMVEHDTLGLCEVVHVSGDGTSLRLKDEEGTVHKAIDPLDVEPVDPDAEEPEEEEEEEETPPPRKKPAAKPAPKKPQPKAMEEEAEDEDEDDWDSDDDEGEEQEEEEPEEEEEEEDEPPPPRKKPSTKPPVKKPGRK